MEIYSELENIAADLRDAILRLGEDTIRGPILRLEKNIDKVSKCFSGSWLGYHAYVYYKDLQLPPAGAHFSQEWGLNELLNFGSIGLGSEGE